MTLNSQYLHWLTFSSLTHTEYSSPSLIGTPLLPNNSVLIRGVPWCQIDETEDSRHSQYLLPNNSVLIREVSFGESVL